MTVPAMSFGNDGTNGHAGAATAAGMASDTAAHRLGRAWLRATTALGYAITTREMAQHWAEYGEGPAPQPLSNTAQNLAKNGTLVCVVDRPGRRRYVHCARPDVATEPPATDHFEAAVLAALHDAAKLHQRYVTTREVTDAILAGGYVPALCKDDKTRIAWTLATLARPVRQRVAPFADVPGPVTLFTTQRAGAEDPTRAIVRWWRPTHLPLPDPHPETPGTRREAGIRAVEAARAALGRPVTTEEVELWIAATQAVDPTHPVVLTLGDEKGLGRALGSATGYIDRTTRRGQRGVPDSGLVRVHTPFTAGRLLPPRVALDPVGETERHRALATDLVLALRPGQEADYLAWIAQQPGHRDPALQALVALREELLRDVVARYLPPEAWGDVTAHLFHGLDMFEGWLAQLQGRKRWSGLPRRFRRILSARSADIAALTRVLNSGGDHARTETGKGARETVKTVFADLTPVLIVGEAATLATATGGRTLHDGLVAVLGATGQNLHPVLRRARRVPPPPGVAWTRSTPKAKAVMAEHLERVDAFAVAVDHVGIPLASTLVADAVALLGTTLRDVRVVERLLDRVAPNLGWAHRGLLVASGLLGVAPDPLRWISTFENAHAGVLATVLGDPTDAGRALRRLLALQMPVATRQVVADAISQVDAGEWLAAIG